MDDVSHLEKSLGLNSKSFKRRKITTKFHKSEGTDNQKESFNGELGWKSEYRGLKSESDVAKWAEQG